MEWKNYKVMSDLKKKRETERSEVRHKTAKIISGFFPGGSSVYEIFTAIIQPLHEQRKDDWVKNVTLRLQKLEQEKSINLKDLAVNKEFNTIITRATLLALQTHIEEKRRALQSIVVDTSEKVNSDDFDFDLTNSILTILERFGPLHIYLLKIISKLKDYDMGISGKPNELKSDIVYKIDNTLVDKEAIVNLCWVDLLNAGLVHQNSRRGMQDIEFGINPRLTPIGRKLMEYIQGE